MGFDGLEFEGGHLFVVQADVLEPPALVVCELLRRHWRVLQRLEAERGGERKLEREGETRGRSRRVGGVCYLLIDATIGGK